MAYTSKYARMTKADLRKVVNDMVTDINARLTEYREQGEEYYVFENAINRLHSEGGVSSKGKGIAKGYRLNKGELVEYAESLQRTLAWDMFTPQGKKKSELSFNKAWKTFSSRASGKGWTKKEFRAVGELLGALGDGLLSQLGSDQIIETTKKAIKKGVPQNTITNIVREAYSENQGGTQRDIIDAIENKLAIELKR